jgi:hypothetical protein
MSDVTLRITMSAGHATHNAMQRSGGSIAPTGSEPGDTLVAFQSTRNVMNDIERQATIAFGRHGDTAVHTMMMNDAGRDRFCAGRARGGRGRSRGGVRVPARTWRGPAAR